DQAVFPADYTLVAADAGDDSISTTPKTAGNKSFPPTYTATSSITGSQSGIAVNPAAASSLVVSGFASSSTAGTAGTLTVTAKDADRKSAVEGDGGVHLTRRHAQADLLGVFVVMLDHECL